MNAAKPKTRDRILASARELFFSKGLDETSIAEICKHSGVSNGSLFHHFPTKEAIALEIFVGIRRHYWEHVIAAMEAELRPQVMETFDTIANRSILETATRSLATQITALLVLVALLVLGGATLQQFVATLIVGFASGMYSSIFNAAPLLLTGTAFIVFAATGLLLTETEERAGTVEERLSSWASTVKASSETLAQAVDSLTEHFRGRSENFSDHLDGSVNTSSSKIESSFLTQAIQSLETAASGVRAATSLLGNAKEEGVGEFEDSLAGLIGKIRPILDVIETIKPILELAKAIL